jgi:YesN/AraC family two-component response regulator
VKICVVDDESAVRSGIIYKLNSLKKNVEVFDTGFGYSAFNLIMSIRPDVVITDILMPELDGLELLRQIKHHLPATRVVLLSGYSEFEYARKALEHGAMNYLLKPVDPAKLLELIMIVEQEEKNKLDHDFHRHIAHLSEQSGVVDVLEIGQTELWFDTNTPKRILLNWELDNLKRALEEPLILVFKYMGLYGAIVGCTWHEKETFTTGSQFARALLNKMGSYEELRFWGSETDLRQWGGEQQLKQAANIRHSILQHVKELNVSGLERLLGSYMELLQSFSMQQVRKECAFLIAAIDEALTTKYDINVVEEDKLAYWISWVNQHKDWNDLKGQLEKFVLGGVKALAELEQIQPGDIIEKVMHIVSRHKGADINLESVASQLYIHPVTLSRIFKQQTGENFIRYVVRQKMKQAEKLLLESDKKVGVIAEEVGYTDYKYFSVLFKQNYSLSPTEYRKKHGMTDG